MPNSTPESPHRGPSTAEATSGRVDLTHPIDPSDEEIARIVQIRHDCPHRILGPHRLPDDTLAVRTFVPDADRVTLRVEGTRRGDFPMARIHPEGLYQAVIGSSASDRPPYHFLVRHGRGEAIRRRDAYAFGEPWFSVEDEDAFLRGMHSGLHDKLGAHLQRRKDAEGVVFAVWAPHAERVSVVGTFNGWDGRLHPMRRLARSGVWELFVPDVREGEFYKFEIRSTAGMVFLKGDPFASRTEKAPATASIVCRLDREFRWSDSDWMQGRRGRFTNGRPPVIRRVDLNGLGGPAPADTTALDEFLADLRQQGWTHVELPSPPHSGSASAFAPDPNQPAPGERMSFIDACHRAGLGVILPTIDTHAPSLFPELAWFDGTRLYETDTEDQAGAAQLAVEKGEVRSFLLSNAVHWFEQYHADGWRTDRRCAHWLQRLREFDPARFGHLPILVCEPPSASRLPAEDTARIVDVRHEDPHAVLGPHYSAGTRELTLRAWIPDAGRVWARFEGEPESLYELQRVHPQGLFETTLDDVDGPLPYRLLTLSGEGHSSEFSDPYAFRDFTFSDLDRHLFGAGKHYRIYEKLGAHAEIQGGISGVRFAVWAPSAPRVSVVGPFNGWDGRRHPMHRLGLSGVWELFIPGLEDGELYKYEVRAGNGHLYLKSDPYAFHSEVSPGTASVVYGLEGIHRWQDGEWMERRRSTRPWERPVAIYEVHLGSWMRRADGGSLSYGELAERLIAYVEDLGFTHIELLPIAEHPYEPSWGYQVTGYYAATSRYGRPEDLMRFIDLCHQRGIGVLLDWVPGHFPKDAHALAWFDGTGLYEHADPRKGEHRDWGTLVFNYGRHEVDNFLVANALFWLEHYHFDGLRVDAVASMLYLDYSRTQPGSWIPNQYGGRENLEAIEFLRHTNVVVHREFPGVLMIAEESTAWPKVSRPVDQDGLGFGYKWNMGWMHDVLDYLGTPPEERRHHHHTLTFSLVYAFDENYVLSLSHDEVVHLKRSLLEKMPGSEWEKFANLRLLYAFMYAHPGKKLLFMGGEFGQKAEWNHAAGLEWELLHREPHRQLQTFVRDLNTLYRSEPAFFEMDFKAVGFEWLDANNAEDGILTFLRKARDPRKTLLFAMNFSAVSRPCHRIGVPYPVAYRPIFSSNARRYGGADDRPWDRPVEASETPWNGREYSIELPLPALSAVVLQPEPPTD